MSTDLCTPGLLRRIAQLEATAGRTREDQGSLRSAVSEQGLRLRTPGAVRARGSHIGAPTADAVHARASGGLASATARGQACACPMGQGWSRCAR